MCFWQVKIVDLYAKSMPYTDIMNKLKLNDGFPVINLIGAGPGNPSRAKLYAGVARACFNCDAAIVDSATETGLEPYAIKKGMTGRWKRGGVEDEGLSFELIGGVDCLLAFYLT